MFRKRVVSQCFRRGRLILPVLALMLPAGAFSASPVARARMQAPATAQVHSEKQATFATPEEAMQAIVEAGKAKDRTALGKVLGPDVEKLLSGDEVADRKDLEDFAAAVQESAQVRKVDDSRYTLLIGKDNWPYPIPISRAGDGWYFDMKAGIEEILNRRIGENELSAIATCRAYAVAQWEYFTEGDWDNDGVAEYAQRFLSSPGKHDGLFWETTEDAKASPLGKLVAAARAQGYGPGNTAGGGAATGERHPYHGYYFKILTRQGSHAPGGKYSYIINGNMIAGYALIAYPDKWGNSGIMTFIVNQQGRVYQKDLGPETVKVAGAMVDYDPDPSWKLVEP
ncbi:MAG TPA: DUF2950 domain-containing protein [Acidobacteriota bacterium]|nr:DUF2950 domain-containing protein [Acidobacteriota bacterium]